jgi:hypothetical protein
MGWNELVYVCLCEIKTTRYFYDVVVVVVCVLCMCCVGSSIDELIERSVAKGEKKKKID